MITLYTWKTPNGRKVSIALEELGLTYEVRAVDISKNEQFEPAFLKLSPNNRIPAITDDEVRGSDGEPLAIFESGAILTYLAEKTGRLLPTSGAARYEALAWLAWQVGGLGPMLGQLGFFNRATEKVPMAIERYAKEAERLFGVMDRRLAKAPYLGGADYGIADIASYPWVVGARANFSEPIQKVIEGSVHLCAWLERVGDRPAVRRGMAVPAA